MSEKCKQRATLMGIKHKCKNCNAIHHYLPSRGCQNCGKDEWHLTVNEKEPKVAKKKEKEAELRLEIDEFNLEKEWLGQSPQVYEWAKKVADAQFAYDSAKSNTDIVEAELDQQIRASPDEFGLVKITETVVDKTITNQMVHQTAVKAQNKARHELGMAQAAVTALDNRKRTLSKLVELWIHSYYSDSGLPKGPVEDMSDESKAEIRKRGNSRKDKRGELFEDGELDIFD